MYSFFLLFILSRNMILILTPHTVYTPQSHHIFNLCKLNAINMVVSIVLKRIHNCNSICRFNSVTKASVKRLTICRIHIIKLNHLHGLLFFVSLFFRVDCGAQTNMHTCNQCMCGMFHMLNLAIRIN